MLILPPAYRKMRGLDVKALIPREFVGGESSIYEQFLRCAHEVGDKRDYAIQLFKVLPNSIKRTWTWFDRIAELWRYEYGLPYDQMPQGTIISGTNVHLPVNELYTAMKIADMNLTRQQFLIYIHRLSDRPRHADVIFEMRPMKNIKAGLKISFEVQGLGQDNTTLDWKMKGRFINISLDVKNRTKSIINHMKGMIPDLNCGAEVVSPSSAPDPEDLFKNTEKKFRESSCLRQLQGVWIHTDVQEDEHKLTCYFMKTLNRRKVHFAILSDWKDDAFILARNRVITSVIKRTFHLTESRRFVTQEYAKASQTAVAGPS